MRDYVIIDGQMRYWPMCAVPGCQNRQCLRLQSIYCWPHTDVGKLSQSLKTTKAEPVTS